MDLIRIPIRSPPRPPPKKRNTAFTPTLGSSSQPPVSGLIPNWREVGPRNAPRSKNKTLPPPRPTCRTVPISEGAAARVGESFFPPITVLFVSLMQASYVFRCCSHSRYRARSSLSLCLINKYLPCLLTGPVRNTGALVSFFLFVSLITFIIYLHRPCPKRVHGN